MIKAKRENKNEIITLLTSAFENNLSVNYIIKQDKLKLQRIRALMDYSFEMCFRFGEVWLSEDNKACALVLYPDKKKATLKSVWLDIKLIFRAIGINGIKKALNREAQIKKLQPKEPMSYLWFIGVDPIYQHKGIGSELLQEILDDAVAKKLPVYLETSTIKNLPWYKHFGFTIYDQLHLTYDLYFLKRQ
jgi:ribosomal protein S18 acetylase RimI-like enzyme